MDHTGLSSPDGAWVVTYDISLCDPVTHVSVPNGAWVVTELFRLTKLDYVSFRPLTGRGL